LDDVRGEYPEAEVYLAAEEFRLLTNPSENLSAQTGVPLSASSQGVLDLSEGLTLHLGPTAWQVLDVSGHSPGGRALYCAAEKIVFVGDALFAGSIGRTDFHHSDQERLIGNIQSRLLTLPDETRVLSGHGPETTIGVERRTNPFL
jgi:glyoxylase-like metal-dependent hydrolase (beta-lactamase superfamily II)